MGYTVVIGKVKFDTAEIIKGIENEENSSCLNWKIEIEPCEGKEPEGLTNKEFTITAGEPERMLSYTGWSEFMRSCKPLQELAEVINPRGSDGYIYALNTSFIKGKIEEVEKLIPSMSEVNQDRAKWFCFWTKEAVNRYGNDAAIGFW